MKDRFFLDTNILVYSFEPKTPSKSKEASRLIQEGLLSARGVISYQVLQEFYNLAFRKFVRVMSEGDARDYYRKVLRPLCAIQSSHNLFSRGFAIHEDTKYGWYDSLIIAAALEANCTILYSEDFQDGQKVDSLTIRNPF